MTVDPYPPPADPEPPLGPPDPPPGQGLPTLDDFPRLKTWWGSIGFALFLFATYMVVAHLAPGLIVAVLLIATGGGGGERQLTQDLLPWLPWITLWGAIASALIVVGLGRLRWLPAAPHTEWNGWGRPIGWTALAAALCVGGQEVLIRVLHELGQQPQEQAILLDAFAANTIPFVISVVLFAPIGEELAFRRVMFSSVDMGAGRVSAYVVSGVLFAAIHGNPSAFVLYLWMAACFAFAYERTGHVGAAIAVHMVNNAVAAYELVELTRPS